MSLSCHSKLSNNFQLSFEIKAKCHWFIRPHVIWIDHYTPATLVVCSSSDAHFCLQCLFISEHSSFRYLHALFPTSFLSSINIACVIKLSLMTLFKIANLPFPLVAWLHFSFEQSLLSDIPHILLIYFLSPN